MHRQNIGYNFRDILSGATGRANARDDKKMSWKNKKCWHKESDSSAPGELHKKPEIDQQHYNSRSPNAVSMINLFGSTAHVQ
uniref:Uncharacterized protein n=1 Tax=Candidatus Kentrum sp. FW TaxID=2126338 RepID=A0A450THD8_9GAMM|nr:MAG: hypothetical protein BECKFW1821C_GA0114237_101023 [Candidatus Kentron sp. FW]